MALTRSFIRNAATTPVDARILLMGLVVANADGSPRPGVLGGADPSIVSTLPSWNVAIAAAEFVTTKGRADGVAIFGNDGTVNVPIGTAPTSNSRIDVIYVKHNDDTTGDPNPNPTFDVAKGTAAASPVKPAIPTGALELATLRVYSGTTATNGGSNALTNTYRMTAARGGVVPFRTKADLDAWANPVPEQLALVIATGEVYRRLSGAWATLAPQDDDTGWIVPTLTNGWSVASPAVEPVGYRRKNGVVYLRGRIFGGSTAAAFVLPVGFRPGSRLYFSVSSSAGTTQTLLTIESSGSVGAVSGSQPSFSDGVSFLVDG